MKHFIRQQIKEKIKDIPSEKKQEYSANITKKIIEKFWHLQTRHIYISMPDEVDTTKLIKYLQQAGKKIYSCETPPEQSIEIDIIIVPWRAFTQDNKRLWRGGWRYDKLLAQYPNAKKIWICFLEQIVENILQEEHDILMDEVLT